MTTSPSQTENNGIAARYYAPPTFTSRDPLFEKYFWMSPYAYCANNPVKFVDPTGMLDDEAEANKFHQRAVLSGAVLLNPVVGVPNDVKTLCTGKDIYGNQATTSDRLWALAGIATFGIGNIPKNSRELVNLLRINGIIGDGALDLRTAITTIILENEKK